MKKISDMRITIFSFVLRLLYQISFMLNEISYLEFNTQTYDTTDVSYNV